MNRPGYVSSVMFLLFLPAFFAGVPAMENAQPQAAGGAMIDSSQIIADRIIKAKVPVLIDFWASWCAPCRILNPIIASLEKEYSGKMEVVKVNIDVHRIIAGYFRVMSIPAVYIVKDKAVVKMLPGLQSKEEYKKAIDEVLAMPAPSAPAGMSSQ